MRARSDCGTRLRTIASQVAQLSNSGRPLRILGTIGSSAGSAASCAVSIPDGAGATRTAALHFPNSAIFYAIRPPRL